MTTEGWLTLCSTRMPFPLSITMIITCYYFSHPHFHQTDKISSYDSHNLKPVLCVFRVACSLMTYSILCVEAMLFFHVCISVLFVTALRTDVSLACLSTISYYISVRPHFTVRSPHSALVRSVLLSETIPAISEYFHPFGGSLATAMDPNSQPLAHNQVASSSSSSNAASQPSTSTANATGATMPQTPYIENAPGEDGHSHQISANQRSDGD